MVHGLNLNSRWKLVLVGVALLALWAFGDLPGNSQLSRVVFDAAHFPVFGLLAAVIFYYRRLRPSERTALPRETVASASGAHGAGPWRDYLVTALIMVVVSGVTELAQIPTPRDASVSDFFADLFGTAAALAIVAMRDSGLRANGRWKSLAVGLGLIVLLSTAWVVVPIGWIAAATLARDRAFPCVECPTGRLDLALLKTQHASLGVVPIPARWSRDAGETGLLVRLERGEWPGVEWTEPVADWRGYQTLVVELVNPDEVPLDLVLRIDDAEHNYQQSDRFNRRLTLSPASRAVVRIPLAAVRRAPAGRELDLSRIARVILFGVAADWPTGRQFYVASLRLE